MEMLRAAFSANYFLCMKRFEYKVVNLSFKNEEKVLDKLGDEGWELVCSYCFGFYVILKREKENNG